MLKSVLIGFFFLYTSVSYAQKDSIYTIATQMPEPQEGYTAFYRYLQENVYYTQDALERKVEGAVFVQFVVGKKGILENIKIIRGLGFGLDEEVLRVFSEGFVWKAGKENGVVVCVKMTFQVVFRLPR